MEHDSKDAGVILALLQRFNTQRLPRLLALKEKVDSGGILNDYEIEFLSEVFSDAQANKPYLLRNPDYKDLMERAIHLYSEIMDKALENEK